MSTRADYFAFAKAHPKQFVNPTEGGFTILMNEAEIREAEASVAQRLQAKGLPTEWAQVGIVYQDQYGMILRDAVRFPGGALGTYIRFLGNVDGGPGAIVLALYQDHVLLVRRFHHATRTWHLEIPIRLGVKNLSGEENARRELAEEIAATATLLVPMGSLEEGPGLTGSPAELFYADIESYREGNTREGITEVLPVTVPEFERMMRDSEITDSFTIIAYLRAKLQGLL
jgi:ADP-ribose pyrophosphatase